MKVPIAPRFPRLWNRLGPAAVRLAAGGLALGTVLWLSNCRIGRLLSGPAQAGPLSVSPSQIHDSVLAGSDTILRRTVVISSGGRWRAAAQPSWISVDPPTGSAGMLVDLALEPRELEPGPHEGAVTVTPAQQASEPARVAVSLVILQPVLEVEPREVSHSTRSERVFHDTLRVRNTGTGAMVWVARASSPRSWLTLEDTAGRGDGIIALRLSTHDLREGTYETTIVITAPGARDSPATVKIKLQRRKRRGNDDDDHGHDA
ncbi:MAG: BACON domain-containing protein [Gemmatimonadales bacterium]